MEEVRIEYTETGEVDYVRLKNPPLQFSYKDSLKREIERTLDEMEKIKANIYEDERYTRSWNEYMERCYEKQKRHLDNLLEALSYFISSDESIATAPAEIRDNLLKLTEGKTVSNISVLDDGVIYVQYNEESGSSESVLVGRLESKNLLDIL